MEQTASPSATQRATRGAGLAPRREPREAALGKDQRQSSFSVVEQPPVEGIALAVGPLRPGGLAFPRSFSRPASGSGANAPVTSAPLSDLGVETFRLRRSKGSNEVRLRLGHDGELVDARLRETSRGVEILLSYTAHQEPMLQRVAEGLQVQRSHLRFELDTVEVDRGGPGTSLADNRRDGRRDQGRGQEQGPVPPAGSVCTRHRPAGLGSPAPATSLHSAGAPAGAPTRARSQGMATYQR